MSGSKAIVLTDRQTDIHTYRPDWNYYDKSDEVSRYSQHPTAHSLRMTTFRRKYRNTCRISSQTLFPISNFFNCYSLLFVNNRLKNEYNPDVNWRYKYSVSRAFRSLCWGPLVQDWREFLYIHSFCCIAIRTHFIWCQLTWLKQVNNRANECSMRHGYLQFVDDYMTVTSTWITSKPDKWMFACWNFPRLMGDLGKSVVFYLNPPWIKYDRSRSIHSLCTSEL